MIRPKLSMLILTLVALPACASHPILDFDNAWSGHHVTVISTIVSTDSQTHRTSYVIEFRSSPTSTDVASIRMDAVAVWDVLRPIADASGSAEASVIATSTSNPDAISAFVKRSGSWFIFDRGEWAPVDSLKPMLRDFQPWATFRLRSMTPSTAGWPAQASIPMFIWMRNQPAHLRGFPVQVSTFPFPSYGNNTWIVRGSCNDHRFLLRYRLQDGPDPYTASTIVRGS